MPAPITLPRLDEQQQADLQQRYKEAPDAETRTRYQMLVLAQLGHTARISPLWYCVARIRWPVSSNAFYQED